jgi:hypothetical protein
MYKFRVEHLKNVCDFPREEHKQVLVYANLRLLSLLPALERILKIYSKVFFMSETQCP